MAELQSPPPESPPAPAQPGHDEIHMPPNSYWPLVTSIGVAITMVGIVALGQQPFLFILGLIVLLAGIGGWIRDARKEYQELH